MPRGILIVAERWPWFARWLARHAEKRLHRTFGNVRVRGLEAVAELAQTRPILFVANHVCWWDGLVILYLSVRLLNLDAYAMMLSSQLRQRFFFARAGGFGVDTSIPGDGASAVRFAASLLDRPGRAVWIFPQGGEQPQATRPLRFSRGAVVVGRIAREARVVPVGLLYRFGGEERPELWVSFGNPCASRCGVLEEAVTQELEQMEQASQAPDDCDGFERKWTFRPGRFAVLAEYLLAAMTRFGSAAAKPARLPVRANTCGPGR